MKVFKKIMYFTIIIFFGSCIDICIGISSYDIYVNKKYNKISFASYIKIGKFIIPIVGLERSNGSCLDNLLGFSGLCWGECKYIILQEDGLDALECERSRGLCDDDVISFSVIDCDIEAGLDGLNIPWVILRFNIGFGCGSFAK